MEILQKLLNQGTTETLAPSSLIPLIEGVSDLSPTSTSNLHVSPPPTVVSVNINLLQYDPGFHPQHNYPLPALVRSDLLKGHYRSKVCYQLASILQL